VTDSISPSFVLIDPRPFADAAPYTFFPPDEARIAAVGVGDLVKLNFGYPHPTQKWGAERMWVIVKEVDASALRGELNNDPDEPTSPLRAGDSIGFERYHIIGIEWKNRELAPPAPERRDYWERCLVDQCVLDGEEPVEFLYREEPEPSASEDSYTDSGWCIRGRFGEATDEEIDARELAVVALGAVLNRDDSWIDWIDAPVGTRLLRDFETNEYAETD
jgi:hypothetical protein